MYKLTGYMAEQLYWCEKRVYYAYIEHEASPPKLREGEARKALKKLSLKTSKGGGIELVHETIVVDYKNIEVTGSPDAIIYDNGKPIGAVRAKIRTTLKPHESDWAGLNIASYALQKYYGVQEPILILLIAKDTSALAEAVKHLIEKGPEMTVRKQYKILIRAYDQRNALSILESLYQIALGLRKPMEPSNKKICRSCPFKDICDTH